MVTETPIVCPVPPPHGIGEPFTPCSTDEIAPLLAHLRANAATATQISFPRGTVMPDGRLDLCKQNVGPEGCRAVVAALEDNDQVRSILLGTDGIGDTGADAVAELVQRSQALTTVYLGCNRIGAVGAARLADAIAENRTVTGLWLKRNPLGDEGALALAGMLRRNDTLRVLDLVNTGIGKDGFAALMSALTTDNRTVERLYLGGNGLMPASAIAFAALLRANNTLRALLLNVNHLGDDGVITLAEGLNQNRTLTELALASNSIGPRGLTALLASVYVHPSLVTLDLGYARSTRALGSTANQFAAPEAIAAIGAFVSADAPLRRLDLRGTGLTTTTAGLSEALASNTHLTDLRLYGPPNPKIDAVLQRNRVAQPPIPETATQIRSVYR